jgi:hypothetical protein
MYYDVGAKASQFFDDKGTLADDTKAFMYSLAQITSLETGLPWLTIAKDIEGGYNRITGKEE